MKKVCFSIPCYNEEENIELMTRAIDALFQEKYKGIYEYVIEYIDNYSTDRTREVLQKLCERYPHNVRAIFNTRNFGGVSSFLWTSADGGRLFNRIALRFSGANIYY